MGSSGLAWLRGLKCFVRVCSMARRPAIETRYSYNRESIIHVDVAYRVREIGLGKRTGRSDVACWMERRKQTGQASDD